MTTHDMGAGFKLEVDINEKDEVVNFDLVFDGKLHAYRAIPFDLVDAAQGPALSHVIMGMAQEIVANKFRDSGRGINLAEVIPLRVVDDGN